MTTPGPRTTRVGAVSIAYYVRGRGQTVLCIMGLGGRAADWNEVGFLAPLAERFELVTFDNRGTGASDKPGGPYSLELMADEAVGVLDALGRERAHVVGVSMGGMIAQLLAIRHPARVARLVLVATNTGGPDVVPATPEVLTVLTADRTRPREEMLRTAMTVLTSPGFAARDPVALDTIVALALAQPTPEIAFARQMAAILASDRTASLASIAAPTLVVHGADDRLIPPANGRMLAQAIPGARLVVLPGCGHLPMWECPARLGEVVGEFLAAPG